jgi:acetylornithine deacetylase/succinyl-diaminopimelate desuccinylase-like protein
VRVRGCRQQGARPRRATADLGIRLVSDQGPDPALRALRTHLARHTPHGVTARLTVLAPARHTLDGGHTGVAAVRRACVPVLCCPLPLPSGGSIPFVSDLAATTGLQTPLGFGPPGRQHPRPNAELGRG